MAVVACREGENGQDFVRKARNHHFHGFSQDDEGTWTGPFCFIQAADTQFGMMDSFIEQKATDDVTWDKEIKLTKQAIEAANRMTPRPRFFVVCGDLIDAMPGDKNQNAQTADFKKVFAGLHSDIPLVCVCGNHDVGNTPTPETIQRYRDNYGDEYFSFWVGGVKFIVINSQYYEDDSQVKELSSEHDKWLEAELEDIKQSPCQHLVIFQHIPWYISQPDEPRQYFNMEITMRRRMLSKFRDAGEVSFGCRV